MQTVVQTVEATVDATGDGGELAFVGEFVKAVALPEPGGGFAGPLRLLQQLWLEQQAIIAEQCLAARKVITAAGYLDEPSATILLSISVRFGGVAQPRGQAAGVVLAQVLITAQFAHVVQFTRLVTDLSEEGCGALGSVDLPIQHCQVE